VVQAGDTTVLEVRWQGTQTGPFATPAGTLPAAGLPTESFATMWQDGRLVEERHHLDVLTVLTELGALPAST